MTRRSLLRDTKECVKEMIDGIVAVYPGLSAFPELGLTFLNKNRGNKVAILSGGGSGHEPFPIGFIADNMITGSVSGAIFTSPPTQHILTAIQVLSTLNKGGVLVAVLNYTGDQLNFGLAIERARSKGIEVEKITISDDVALFGTDSAAITGNRGICGCTFIFKLLGALSEEEKSLSEIKDVYEGIRYRVASMGACLVPCKLPNSKDFLFKLKEDEVSFGCGVHGETGIATLKMSAMNDIIAQVLGKILECGIIKPGDKACVLIGNLGSLTSIECFVIAKAVKEQLETKEIRTERMYVGTVMSSLDMRGFQISLLNITERENWLRYLDSPTSAFGWPGTSHSAPSQKPVINSLASISSASDEEMVDCVINQDGDGLVRDCHLQMEGPKLNERESYFFKSAIIAACNALKENTEKINDLDSGCGDGDCGYTMANFADAILAQKELLSWKFVGSCLLQLSKIAEIEMGGTSGAVYSLLLAGASQRISRSWQDGWTSALQTLYNHSPARVGHRTLIDALAPACESYCFCMASGKNEWKQCLKQAVAAAKMGCHNTTSLKPRVGRAAYTGSTKLNRPDAGAFAVTIWLQAIYLILEKY